MCSCTGFVESSYLSLDCDIPSCLGRTETVSESDTDPGQDFFGATIGFATQRDSEQSLPGLTI